MKCPNITTLEDNVVLSSEVENAYTLLKYVFFVSYITIYLPPVWTAKLAKAFKKRECIYSKTQNNFSKVPILEKMSAAGCTYRNIHSSTTK